MGIVRRAGAAALVIGTAIALTGCEQASGLLPTQTVTVTATAGPSASSAPSDASSASPSASASGGAAPSGGAAAPSSSPLADGRGCAPNDVSLRLGFTKRIDDVDGDGRADTLFFTEDRPLRFGIRTASGATIAVADDLPGSVHHGTVGRTELGLRALVDDSATTRIYAYADCRFSPVLTADGQPWSVTLRRPAQATGTGPTGVVCTNLNGGEFVATARAAKRSDGRWNVWWGIIQGDGRADPLTGEPIFSGLPFSDSRVGDAFTSSCNGGPEVYWPDA